MLTRRQIRPLTFDQIVDRVRREYVALPGLRLTETQVSRVCGLDTAVSRRVLRRLVDGEFLTITPSGQYVKAGKREIPS